MTLSFADVGREPILRQRRRYPDPGPAELEALTAALAGPWGRGNTVISEAERAFAAAHNLPGSHSAVFVTNGTDAIVMALEALNVGAGDHVLAPSLTWQATAAAATDVNALPFLIDVTADQWTIDVDHVEAHIHACLDAGTPLPKAIIIVHIYQRAADLRRLLTLCQQHGIWLIEDCAHAHGGAYGGYPLGTWGVISTFSFESTKPLTCGEGGAVVTGVPLLEQRLRSLRDCGREVAATIPDDNEPSPATAWWRDRVANTPELAAATTLQSDTYRPTAFTAAVLTAQARRFPAEHALRTAGLDACTKALADVPGVTLLAPQPELTAAVLFKFGCLLDPEVWAPLQLDRVRQVIAYLLGGEYFVDAPYTPLAADAEGRLSPHYRPATKRRHHLSADYLKGIDPARYSTPVAHRIHARGLMFDGPFLGEPDAADILVDALTWTRRNARTLAS